VFKDWGRMYYYILDLGDRNIAKLKEKMEVIMASYGISGDFGKISPLSSAYELAKRAVAEGYSTIVAVGNNQIINQVANALVNTKSALGIVPLGVTPSISELIGAYSLKDAMGVLRTRKVEVIDVCKVNQKHYFLTQAVIKNPRPLPTVLDFGKFKSGGKFCEIVVSNGDGSKRSFRDGFFCVKIDQKKEKGVLRWFQKTRPGSFFREESVVIETEEKSPVIVEGEVIDQTPCQIKIVPLSLKILVARLH